jgi:hypothetical protein
MKKLFLIVFLMSLSIRVIAPIQKSLLIPEPPPIEPFKKLIYAVGMVEGMGDTTAYNEREMAAGYFQIRPIRLEDYNNRTGNKYSMNDMFDYNISEKVFLYFASQIGPYDLERIAKNWNGSGAKTIEYWERIKEYL